MKRSYRNYKQLAMDILRGGWLLDCPHNYINAAQDFLSRKTEPLSDEDGGVKAFAMNAGGGNVNPDDVSAADPCVLVVPISGILTKYDNCYGTATMEVADILDEYRTNEGICAFVLDIDSPGGNSNAVMPVVEAIRRIQDAGKPILAHCDQACSAAYWIASQCDAIFMDNNLSEVGSIGAYVEILDERENKMTGAKYITIYAPQSSDKNLAYRKALEGDVKPMEAQLAELVESFQSDVKKGRPGLKADTDGVLSGAIFTAQKAVDAGLADSIGNLAVTIENAYVRSLV